MTGVGVSVCIFLLISDFDSDFSSQRSDLKTFLFLNGTLSILWGTILILNTKIFSFLICSSGVSHFYAYNLSPLVVFHLCLVFIFFTFA